LSPNTERLVDLARSSLGELSEAQRLAGLQALRARLPGYRRRQHVYRAAFASSLAAAAVVVVVARPYWGGRGSPLALRVDAAQLGPEGDVEAVGTARPRLHFSDGSEVSMATGARLRVQSIDAHGARVVLERGEAHVDVSHLLGAHWAFDAGPFDVAVTGTSFALSWREDAQRLDVRLENGSVNVSGPMSDGTLALRAGQWLTVQGGEVRIRRLGAEEDTPVGNDKTRDDGADPSAARPPSSGDTPPAFDPGPARVIPRHPARDHGWASALARGQSESVVADAVALGLDGVFAQGSADDLAALADAARYTHRQDVARGALLAQRRRFAGSERARIAAFGLGRVEDADQDFRAALTWFDTYLAEAPEGRYASEALGRKMTLVKTLDGNAAAKSLAEIYLRRFPGGTYAAAARAVLETP
jgi:hypothetical protein